jgi:hypothetical protein
MNKKPLSRGFYAFNAIRAGDFLLYVESDKYSHQFVYLPGGHSFYLTKEDFSVAIDTGVLSLVEQLPDDIYEESLMLSSPTK